MVSWLSGACPALSFENDGPDPELARMWAQLPEQEVRSQGDIFGAAAAAWLVGWLFPWFGEALCVGPQQQSSGKPGLESEVVSLLELLAWVWKGGGACATFAVDGNE